MSLYVYLTLDEPHKSRGGSGIFVRRNGATVEITRDDEESREVYSRNITHNLNGMAEAAGIYDALWRPEEIGITKAAQLIEPLTRGLERLRHEREAMERHNPPNGWGDYQGLVDFTREYLAAAIEWPMANVSVWR